MRRIVGIILLIVSCVVRGQSGEEILKRVDQNLSSVNRVFESTMIIHGKRGTKTIKAKTFAEGDKKSFTEYLSPAGDKGTKMLKLENLLWIYSPGTDRIIQISGHMLRQPVMGSDLSYEDMMEERKLTDIYSVKIEKEEEFSGRKCYLLSLTAKVEDAAYYSQRMWVDAERFVPLMQELYSRSGKLLKRVELRDVQKIEGRWFPMSVLYKDVLKEGEGTEFIMTSVKFDQKIPGHIFTKAALKK